MVYLILCSIGTLLFASDKKLGGGLRIRLPHHWTSYIISVCFVQFEYTISLAQSCRVLCQFVQRSASSGHLQYHLDWVSVKVQLTAACHASICNSCYIIDYIILWLHEIWCLCNLALSSRGARPFASWLPVRDTQRILAFHSNFFPKTVVARHFNHLEL